MSIDTTGWTKFAETSNADFYEIEPTVLAVVPREGSRDDAASAEASIRAQLEHLRASRQSAGVLVFMDPVAEQDRGARAVYRTLADPALHRGFALVGGTAFGRTMASIFLGLSRPRVPIQVFATAEEALAWLRRLPAAPRTRSR